MAKSKQEALQNEIDKAFSPLEKRRDNYLKAVIQLREKLLSHFFNDQNKQDLLESAVEGQQLFDWSSMKPCMETCLVDEKSLAACADALQSKSQARISITDALDYQIKHSGLPLVRTPMGYEFNPIKPLTPKAQAFMQQWAGVLSIYRVYLSIYEIYRFDYDFLKVDVHQGCLVNAQEIKEAIKQAQYDVAALFHQAKDNARVIKKLLASLRDGEDVFDHAMKMQAANLTNQFDLAARVIENCYKKHPNDSMLFFVKDSDWQSLLKGVAAELFDNQYTYSSYAGTLTILPKFMETVIAEITHFYMTVVKNQINYRAEILGNALSLTTDVITTLRVVAAREDLSLQRPITISTSEPKLSMAASMYALYGMRFKCTEEYPSDESSEEFNFTRNTDGYQ